MRSFRSIFLSLNVSRKYLHQKFIQDNLKIDEETTFDDLWTKLAFYWNFLNFDLLEHVIKKFRIENLKHKMESYKDDLQSFQKATRLCVFVNCWPLNGEMPPETEFREFVTKIKLDWENCTLEDIETTKRVFIRKFLLPEYALQPGEIIKGCISITWLIPALFVNALKEAVETTSSDFFMEHKIETITIDRKVCHPSPSRKHVDYPKEQFTSQGMGEAQREKSPLGILPEKLHSFISGTSEEQPFPKETHQMRLAEEILSGKATSMVPSEKVQLSTYPSDIQGGKLAPSYLSKLKPKFSIHPQMRSKLGTSETPPVMFDTPTPDKVEVLPKSYTHLGGTMPRSGFLSSSSEYWSTPPEKDVRKGDWVNVPTAAERYVREKCVDEIAQHVKLLPSPEQYLSKAEVEADPSLPTKYKDYLSSTPAIRAALYTTFNAKMTAEVFSWSQHTESPPPTTITELFTAFTLKTLLDHLSTHPVHHKQQLKVTTFSDLPTDVYKQFRGLCRMAYEGILNRQQLVFSAAHLPTRFAPLGLMQEVPQFYTEGRASSYHFIHLTLQEYLAAIHISQLPSREKIRLFQKHLESGHFKMTIRFLAGLTKLTNIPYRIPMVGDTELTYFHCLFEAKDISLTTRTLGSDELYIRSCYSWTPLDYYVTGHTISHSNCPWRLNFNNYFMDDENVYFSYINDEKLELFCQGCAAPGGTGCRGHISYADFSGNDLTSKSIQSFVNLPPYILYDTRMLCLSHNKLDESACHPLAKAIPSMSGLEELWLGYNSIGSGGAVALIKALWGSRVKKLKLANTGIGMLECEALCELLSTHSLKTTLTHLNLARNTIGEEGMTAIAKILVENKSMTTLWLFGCHISGQGASELAAAMSDMLQHNTSLEYLWLCDDSVGEEGVHQLMNSLKHNQTLRELWLPEKYKSETNDQRIYWL